MGVAAAEQGMVYPQVPSFCRGWSAELHAPLMTLNKMPNCPALVERLSFPWALTWAPPEDGLPRAQALPGLLSHQPPWGPTSPAGIPTPIHSSLDENPSCLILQVLADVRS